jgi:hypothetical protein
MGFLRVEMGKNILGLEGVLVQVLEGQMEQCSTRTLRMILRPFRDVFSMITECKYKKTMRKNTG